MSGRNERWKRTKEKHGISVEIVFDNLEENEAFQVEKDTILEWLCFCHPLCNLTSGGEGVSGCVVSEHTRKLISSAQKGRVKSDVERLNISLAQKGKKKSKEHCLRNSLGHIGIKQTEETRLKRINTLLIVGTNNDKHSYIFFSKEDVFIGTRKELSVYSGIKSRDLRNLFTKSNAPVAKGWSIVSLQQLLILKEILCP